VGCEAVGIHDLQAREFLGYSQGFPLVEELGSRVPVVNWKTRYESRIRRVGDVRHRNWRRYLNLEESAANPS
jgi:hypothetical protein